MSVTIKVIRGRDFIQSSSEEKLDLAASRRILTKIATTAISPPFYNILLDLGRNQWRLSTNDIFILASEISRIEEFRGDKLAVLALPGDNFSHAEFLELCSVNRGANVKAFTNFEDAIQWFYNN